MADIPHYHECYVCGDDFECIDQDCDHPNEPDVCPDCDEDNTDEDDENEEEENKEEEE